MGGLANRMRSIHAAVALAKSTQSHLRILWFKDQGLNCRFDQLFQPLQLPDVSLREATVTDFWMNDRPRKKNFFIPRIFEQFAFDARIYEKQIPELMRNAFDFAAWAKGRKVYIASCHQFYTKNNDDMWSMFRPIPTIQHTIDKEARCFNTHTWGIHIRRTDHVKSIKESPTELFVQWMAQQIATEKDTLFYLATDSEEDKAELVTKFGKRIITSANKADRNSVEGMQDAVVSMYLLARTKGILGSFFSSYSEIAAQINHVEFKVLSL